MKIGTLKKELRRITGGRRIKKKVRVAKATILRQRATENGKQEKYVRFPMDPIG